ncbi:MAG: inositol monophosphatase family protein, partial [Microbacterium sp.]
AGAWLGEGRLAVNIEMPAGALLATGFGYDPATHAGDLERVARVMPLARDLRRAGAASLDFAYVAAGRLDGYFERGLQPWDHAAGALLVTEAGGRVGGAGPEGRVSNALSVASAPAVFDRLLAAALGR